MHRGSHTYPLSYTKAHAVGLLAAVMPHTEHIWVYAQVLPELPAFWTGILLLFCAGLFFYLIKLLRSQTKRISALKQALESSRQRGQERLLIDVSAMLKERKKIMAEVDVLVQTKDLKALDQTRLREQIAAKAPLSESDWQQVDAALSKQLQHSVLSRPDNIDSQAKQAARVSALDTLHITDLEMALLMGIGKHDIDRLRKGALSTQSLESNPTAQRSGQAQ